MSFVAFAGAMAGANWVFPFALAAAAVFLSDARRRGELGNFDPAMLLRGARLSILVGVVIAALAFSAPWENWEIGASGWSNTRQETREDGVYVVTTSQEGFRESGQRNAHDMGASTVPALLMIGALAWCAWSGAPTTGWRRFIPLAFAAALVLWGIYFLDPKTIYGEGGTISTEDPNLGSPGDTRLAPGPAYFLVLLVPFYLGAAVLAVRNRGKLRGAA